MNRMCQLMPEALEEDEPIKDVPAKDFQKENFRKILHNVYQKL